MRLLRALSEILSGHDRRARRPLAAIGTVTAPRRDRTVTELEHALMAAHCDCLPYAGCIVAAIEEYRDSVAPIRGPRGRA